MATRLDGWYCRLSEGATAGERDLTLTTAANVAEALGLVLAPRL